MKFICQKCGEVEPKTIMYSCPAQAICPGCGVSLEDTEGGIEIIWDEEECVLKRPSFYKEYYPEIYEKYREKIESS